MSDKDRIENAIRHIQTATDIDPWAMEIAVDAMQRMLDVDGDLISRRDAIDAFASLIPYVIDDVETEAYVHGLSDGYAVICNLPSAQQWIPCSERLPDNDESVLISNSHGVTKAWWNGKFWTSIAIKKYKTVTAWMPLPEPYKKGEQDE